MRKKLRSITFFISVFFIFLNVLSFTVIFYLVQNQHCKMTKRNIEKNGMTAAKSVERNFDDMLSYMNDLTLKIYSDKKLNGLCSQLYRGDYENGSEKENMIFQIESLSYDYLYYYGFIHSLGIFIENSEQTDIQIRKTHNPELYTTLKKYREEIQAEVIDNKGVIKCFDIGKEHHIVFARALRDFENVLKDDSVIGTVMVTLSHQYVLNLLKNVQITPNSFAMLINEDGIISYSTQESGRGMNESELQEILANERCETVSLAIDSLNQKLMIAIPAKDISMSASEISETVIRYIIVIALLNLILVRIISVYLSKPMDELVSQIQNIGIEELNGQQINAAGYSEIKNIADNFNQMLRRIEHLVKENYMISISEKNARIEALQSQINPHFIFNTIDTINWKVMFLDVPEVSGMISCLGDMLRYTTYQYGQYVTIEQEIAQIKKYLYIQEIRYDHSFQTYYKIQPSILKIKIPCLIIQPLVENAVVHGLKEKKDGVLVIKIKEKQDILEIMVFDNGHGMDAETKENIFSQKKHMESIGLANVNQRLCLTYGLDCGLQIYSKEKYYTKVKMELPILRNTHPERTEYDKSNCGG